MQLSSQNPWQEPSHWQTGGKQETSEGFVWIYATLLCLKVCWYLRLCICANIEYVMSVAFAWTVTVRAFQAHWNYVLLVILDETWSLSFAPCWFLKESQKQQCCGLCQKIRHQYWVRTSFFFSRMVSQLNNLWPNGVASSGCLLSSLETAEIISVLIP